MKPTLKHLFATAALLLLTSLATQAQDNPDSPGPTPGAPPTGVPIDGGASLLLASGAAYGLRRLRKRRAQA